MPLVHVVGRAEVRHLTRRMRALTVELATQVECHGRVKEGFLSCVLFHPGVGLVLDLDVECTVVPRVTRSTSTHTFRIIAFPVT